MRPSVHPSPNSHGTSTVTEPHIASMRTNSTTAAAASASATGATAAAEPLPDPLGQICVPVKDTPVTTNAAPSDRSSSRISSSQIRPATVSHSTLVSLHPTSSTHSRSQLAAPPEKESTEPLLRTSPTRSLYELQPQTPKQMLQIRDELEQYRLSEQSMHRSTSLLEMIDSLSMTSPAMARIEQHPVRRSPPPSSQRRASSTSPHEQTTPPTVKFSVHRTSGSTNNNTHGVPSVEKSAHSPHPTSLPIDAADTSALKFEDSAEASNFDIDSTDEDDDENSNSGDQLHIIPSSSTPSPTTDRQETSVLQRLPQPPAAPAATAASPRTSLPTGAGLRPQPIAQSNSLVSLAGGADDIFGPVTPRSMDGNRLDSVSPVLNGLPSANNSRPTSSCLVSTSNVGRVDQADDGGLATFFNQPRECASCKSPAVAFACEVCDDFFLCDDCRFNVAVVRAIHDPTHAMLSIQDNHCGSSRTFGGDSVISLSGEGGASSLFNPPCSRCGRVIDDTEPIHRCEQCDYVLCLECFFKPPETVVADSDSPHEHVLKRFQRKSKPGSVHESVVVSKSRSRGGNRVINDYVVVRLLGRGSYAKVKLVQHIRTQELFALKILKKQKKASTSAMNLGRSRVKMASAGVSEDDLLREIAVMKFIDHPNITKLKEVIEDVEAQKVYVIMEYCENGPVHVLGTPPLALEQVRQYGADIMRGLLHLHSEFLYHRDVKPANCLVNHAFVVKIADFGTCNSHIRTKTSDGTLAFSCPEQVRGEEVSGEVVDSWAFALTLYEMAYGSLPVSTTSLLQHRNMLLGPEPIPIPESGDPQLRDLLAAMLTKKLKQRTLLAAAAQHPFFRAFCIDPHGSPYNSMQLAATRQLHQCLLSRGEDGASPKSSTQLLPQQQQSQQQQQQQQQQPPGTLSELYSLALESVHRGKNLKDCFHGVRAVRRIRRKEVEMARHGSANLKLGYADEDDDSGFYADRDVDSSGVLHSVSAALPSPMHSGAMLYGYASSAESANEDNTNTEAKVVSHDVDNATPSKDDEAAVAAKEVEELVQHHLAAKDTKLEVSYVQLAQQSTVEKLNQLSPRATEFRLTHNALTSVSVLRFSAFHALKEVSISFNRLESFPVEVLAAPRLVRLDLSHNRISSISPALVTGAPFLERLNLHHNYITHVGTVPYRVVAAHLSSPASPVTAKSAWNAPGKPATAAPAPTSSPGNRGGAGGDAESRVVSVLAAPCLRHVRLSGNPLESLPLALETTQRLELVLDAIPALMEQWKTYTQARPVQQQQQQPSPSTQQQQEPQQTSQGSSTNMTTSATTVPHTVPDPGVRAGSAPSAVIRAGLPAPPPAARLPAIIVWDDSFPVRIPDVEPAVWLAVNNMAVYRVQTLRTCQARRVVLCQCADPRFPNGVFDSADLEAYFNELTRALQERQLTCKDNGSATGSAGAANDVVSSPLPPVVNRAARSYVESYFFVTDDESEEDGGYHSLVEYLNDALAAKEPVLIVVISNANASAVRTNIVAALSTSLTLLRGKHPDDVGEQVEMVVSTMRSLYG